ncbi:UDP-glucosyltransferase 74F2 [Perilla frutescens var. hirtella]|uniref:anthocyanidin 3-O-glucoside 5-O-glucosyltransferase n=1 Tax=Perilla frutescens var. hirtella TaxID=608512 RepID=A0AAD4P046_PERFH|nr:UDP-glucosyltransferase 74F2 [Perilla frutescens var. hirtella]
MERERKAHRAHILAIPYPSQGHINPALQFCKRLAFKGAKTTLVVTKFINKSLNLNSTTVAIDTISDGYDDGGFSQAKDVDDYLTQMERAGSTSLEDLIKSYEKSNHPIDCIVYDAFFPWVLEVAKKYDIKGAAFFSQACAVNYVYYYVHHGILKLPVEAAATPVELPGLPPLDLPDFPSYIYVHGSYPAYFKMVLDQFSNLEKADFVLINSFYKLEEKVVDSMSKVFPVLTIGPTVPSFYLDNRVAGDNKYDINLFQSEPSTTIISWLDKKPPSSVVYVAFGSMASLPKAQMEEIAWGLKNTNFDFLWVVRTSEKDENVPKEFVEAVGDKGLFVHWSPQLEVLSNKAVGCFFSHGGWNSTTEALSLGVPMVVMPQWTDQTTDAKFVQDVWGVGVRVRVGADGVVGREEIEGCIREVMEGEKGKEMRRNADKWRDLAKEAVSEGGTSDINIDTFLSKFLAKDVADYLTRMEQAGSKTLEDLIQLYQKSNHPIDCIVYDAFLPWALEVAKKYDIKGAAFFTQACAVNYVYYYAHHGLLKLPVVADSTPVALPGLPPLELPDFPSFIYKHGTYPAYFELVLNQFINVEKADFVLVNTFYKLEDEIVDSMTKVCPLLTIGPTLPSFYLDNRIENDKKYDINLFHFEPPTTIINWLDKKPPKSVVYIAFGSMDNLPKSQMEEIAWGLHNTNFDFLWVVRNSDKEEKIPTDFIRASRDKALFVHWSPQLEVLSNEAVGCFFSHGGWNSTTEALSLGVPMVVMPQWTDQTTDAKLVQDVWGVGVRVRVDADGIAGREEVEGCIREVMEGERGEEMKSNASKWRDLSKEAVCDGGTSDLDIATFVSKLTMTTSSSLH